MKENNLRIGVLTSGGDAPGMNAAIRSIVRTAAQSGAAVLGIRRGYSGLLSGDVEELAARSVDGIVNRGGTMLYTARCQEMYEQQGVEQAVNACKYLGLDGLITIGGDGTFRGAQALARAGVRVIGIPATIDNDISCSENTIGFDTACNTALECIDKLRDTMQSHERCSVVEVMGRHAGYLALEVVVAAGATAVLLPERHVEFTSVIETIRMSKLRGRRHHIVLVAEGVDRANEVAQHIHESTGIETRVTVLGHIQRGGSPTAQDRVLATRMGYYAVNLLLSEKSGRIVCLQGADIVDYDIGEALAMHKSIDETLYAIAQAAAT